MVYSGFGNLLETSWSVFSGFWFHVSVGQISGLSRFLGRFCDFFKKN
jgi:hypothetical protein